VYFTLDCNSVTTNQIELFIDATKLTAESGTKMLDQNGNDTRGEATDSYENYFGVSQATGVVAPTAVTVGAIANPTSAVSFSTAGGLLASSAVVPVATYTGTNIFTFAAQDTGSSATPNKVSVEGAATVYKNVDGVWTSAGSTTTYDSATYTATIALTTAPAKGESYKIVVDKYSIVESAAVRGYTHRASYSNDLTDPLTDTARYTVRYYAFTNTAASPATVSTSLGSDAAGYYIDVTVLSGAINLDTVKAATFKVILASGSVVAGKTLSADQYTTYTTQVTATTQFGASNTAVSVFRVYLPSSVSYVPNGDLLIAPSVLTPADSTVPALEVNSFGDPSNTAQDGWSSTSF
jgi:hypothetical protein